MVSKKNTISDLPVPSGPWQTHYNAKQTAYNLYLFAGVGSLGTVIGLVSNVIKLIKFDKER